MQNELLPRISFYFFRLLKSTNVLFVCAVGFIEKEIVKWGDNVKNLRGR